MANNGIYPRTSPYFQTGVFNKQFLDVMVNRPIPRDTSDVEFIIGNDVTEVFNPTNHFVHGFVPAGFKTKTLEKICNLKISKNTETGYREFFLNPKICKFEFLILNEKILFFFFLIH